MAPLAARILDALPQTQCTRCGYPDCAAYAQAIAEGAAAINQCPPGGAEGIVRLAAITGQPIRPLNPANGVEAQRSLAVIDEAKCIGCTLCIKACPTDAILGSNKRMHTVIEVWCTGCERCIPVCPVDCIALEPASGAATGWHAWSAELANQARARYAAQCQRIERKTAAIARHALSVPPDTTVTLSARSPQEVAPTLPATARAATIAAAQARARALRKA